MRMIHFGQIVHPTKSGARRPGRQGVSLCAALLALASLSERACGLPVQWTIESGGNGHWYEVVAVPEGISWTDARDAAELAGGHLASITSAGENAFVFSLIDTNSLWRNNVFGPWIGGYQTNKSAEATGHWTWVDGEAWSYTAWAPSQPDNYLNLEDYLHYYSPTGRGSTWNDWEIDPASGAPVAYVIELIPEPGHTTAIALACASFAMLGWIRARNRSDRARRIPPAKPPSA